MRFLLNFTAFCLAFAVASGNVAAQIKKTSSLSNKTTAKKTSEKIKNSENSASADKSNEKAQAAFEEIRSTADATERIEKLKKFIGDFPKSELRTKAVEMLVVSHVEAGEAAFRGGASLSGAEHFQAAAKAFEPSISDKMFDDLIVKLPFNLFFRNERGAALETAKIIEQKTWDNAPRLLALANFYLATETDAEAKRLANRAAEIAPESAAAQMTLGMAHRIAFHLEAASQSYGRALELDPTNTAAKRNLADAWRGLGQNEDALKLYRELLEANSADEAARNGLILTLFNTGQKDEAERELAAALESNPKNLVLQTAAAYWYATSGDGKRAVELAQKAVETEPRYVWGQIALARGLLLERRPIEAERALLTARQHGNFPTLDYELANVHLAAGLYDEAADDLRRAFVLKNGKLETRLAGRADAQADNFIDLISRERRASIFQPKTASSETEAAKLKELLALSNALADNADETALTKSAVDFSAGADEMIVHRQLYAARKLLSKKIALPQVLDLTRSATEGLEKSLEVPSASAAVFAEELYEPRRLAITRGTIINIPDVPRETLRQIMRGRVEELAGWTLFQQDKPAEAVVRLRRAVAVLPANSVWWRSSYWKMGLSMDALGKSGEALEAYIRSYRADTPNQSRRIVIESLYQKIYGSLDGLEQRLSADAAQNSAAAQQKSAPASKPAPTKFVNPLPNIIGEIVQPKPAETPRNVAAQPSPASEIKTETKPENSPEIVVSPTPEPEIKQPETIKTKPSPEIKTEKSVVPEIKAETQPTPEAVPTPEKTPEIVAEKPEETLEVKPEAKPEAKSDEQTAEPKPNATGEIGGVPLSAPPKANPARPRVVVRQIVNSPVKTETPPAAAEESKPAAALCIMDVGFEQISILRNGGNATLQIDFGNADDAGKMVLTVDSPNDISAILQPVGETQNNRRLYQIYSTSEITKVFTITLESPCGKREVKVKVR